jgi:MFS family permease
MNQYFNRIASVLVVMVIMVACNIYTFIPIYGNIASTLSIAPSDVVIAGSSFIFFYACGLLTFANSADRFGKKRFLFGECLPLLFQQVWWGLQVISGVYFSYGEFKGFVWEVLPPSPLLIRLICFLEKNEPCFSLLSIPVFCSQEYSVNYSVKESPATANERLYFSFSQWCTSPYLP